MEAWLYFDDANSEFHKAFANEERSKYQSGMIWTWISFKIPKLVLHSKTHFYFLENLLSFLRFNFILFFERFVQLRDNEWWDSRRKQSWHFAAQILDSKIKI